MSEQHAETKQMLRKLDFPLCAKEALLKIGNLLSTRAPSIKQMDLSLGLMSEFVFYEVDRRGNKRSALSPIMELQLLEVLYDALNDTNLNDVSRNSVFLTLFTGATANQRSGVLSKLVSIALATKSPKILQSASTWMQQLGNTSAYSCKLAENLVTDYFILLPKSLTEIQQLPQIAPQFTANFLTAIGELYFSEKNPKHFPPQSLLEAVVMWTSSDYKLCIAAQIMQTSLPPGAIAMEATTPIAGLLKWTMLAPLNQLEDELYAQLHLALINSLLEIPFSPTTRAINASQLNQLHGALFKYVMQLEKQAKSGKASKESLILNDTCLQLALDRYAQVFQVAFSVHCIYGNLDELLNQMQFLPSNHLVNVITNMYKRNK